LADKTLVDKADTPLVNDESNGDKKDNGEDEGVKADTIAEKVEADSTKEKSSPSPEKPGAGKAYKPRRFLPLTERSLPAKLKPAWKIKRKTKRWMRTLT